MRQGSLLRVPRAGVLMLLAVLCALLLAGCMDAAVEGVPTSDQQPPSVFPGEVVTADGRAGANLYGFVFAIAVAVFVIVEGLLLVIAWRFRRRKTDVALPTQTHGNNLMELLWTVIPAITVTVLFVATFLTLQETEASDPDPDVVVEVVGFQWQWTFQYPEYTNVQGDPLTYTGAGKQGPELVLPVGRVVKFNLNAQDVIHSFYVPQFFYKKDVIPGRVNTFDVTIDQVGTYGGQCAEFCGLAHADMYFTIRAVPPDEFTAWVAEEQQKASATPAPAPSGAATIGVTAIGIVEGFDPTEIQAPADTPLTVTLTNLDPNAPHDFGVRGGNPDGSDFLGDPDAAAGEDAVYQVPPIPAGSYEFFCTIHPNMVGTLTVGE